MSEKIRSSKAKGLTRASLLKRAGVAAAALGAGGGLAACGSNESPGQVPTDTNAASFPPMPPMPGTGMPGLPAMQAPTNQSVTSFFTRDEATTVEAIVARLIPGDKDDPGAREAGVPTYIDTKLAEFASFATPTYFDAPFAKPTAQPTGPQPQATTTILVRASELPRYGFQSSSTPQEAYREGLATLDRFTRRLHGDRFAALAPARQDAVLEVLEAGKAGGFPTAKDFFKLVLEDTYEGMFADPSYGGNRNYSGWNLVGYLGAQRAYTPSELKNGPREKRVQGLREMPPMNPGVPQDHVLLPISGTRPHGNG
jgi:gluconate 2-dehydrogenase gamma chain